MPRRPPPRYTTLPNEDPENPRPVLSWAGARRLLAEARPEAWRISVATICLAVGSVANLGLPAIAGNIVDACSAPLLPPGEAKRRINGQLLVLLVVVAVGGIAAGLRALVFGVAGVRVMYRLRVKLFANVSGCGQESYAVGA